MMDVFGEKVCNKEIGRQEVFFDRTCNSLIDLYSYPYFMERLGINTVLNYCAIELNGKYYLVVRVEGNDRKSFFAVVESDTGIDGFHFWDYPVILPDTCPSSPELFMLLAKIS